MTAPAPPLYREGMTQDKPTKPPARPKPAKLAQRENALRDNLLRRKQQQRARAAAPTDNKDEK